MMTVTTKWNIEFSDDEKTWTPSAVDYVSHSEAAQQRDEWKKHQEGFKKGPQYHFRLVAIITSRIVID